MSPATRLRHAIARAEAGDAKSVFAVFAAAADRGNIDGQFWVGKAYLDGKGVPPSRNTASFWLEKAAAGGHVDAQATLATVYLTGAGRLVDMAPGSPLFSDVDRGEPDFGRALKLGLQAAEAGHAEAQALLGYIYSSGPSHIRDVQQADRWYRASAEAGCAQGSLGHGLALMRTAVAETQQTEATAQLALAAAAKLPLGLYLYGVALENGVGIAKDPEAAAEHFRQAAERGVRQGQAKWGLALMEGRGVARDTTNGESWLRRAALAGDAEAAALVGDLYARGGDLPPNFAEAAIWYTRAAEGGHAAAARTLATLYKNGAGVPRDENEAARWFRISGERGDKLARSSLADVVLRGGGQAEDRVRTREWFAAAANEGDLVAAFNYGVCLAEGVGIERDLAAAAQWLRRAADGVVNAQFWYGRMLAEGQGVPVDLQGGREWIKRAADAGLVEAQVALAEMMVNGRGGPRDHVEAKAVFEAAAGRGHPGAIGLPRKSGSARLLPTIIRLGFSCSADISRGASRARWIASRRKRCCDGHWRRAWLRLPTTSPR
jgi:TPR repeat protein